MSATTRGRGRALTFVETAAMIRRRQPVSTAQIIAVPAQNWLRRPKAASKVRTFTTSNFRIDS